jgi:hypothetical protein
MFIRTALDCRSHLPAKRGRKLGMTLPSQKTSKNKTEIQARNTFFFQFFPESDRNYRKNPTKTYFFKV